jgi:transcriptional regulator with XRE-family HTH domain
MKFETILNERRLIGKILQQKRKEKGVTLYRASIDCGMQSTQLKCVELGRTAYAIDTLLHYADYLNADIFSYFSPHRTHKCFTCNEPIEGRGYCSRECADQDYINT